ncbi:MAG TPA: aryl-sulfate sulfotransferase [Bryobacteraceae bacterium]|nr:aryl-sulfate sulfotransferase [Bryobacteraceae bacterium]
MRLPLPTLFLWSLCTVAATPLAAELSVTLAPSLPSPAPVGTMITWEPRVSGAAAGSRLWYRYRERSPGRDFRVIRDYGPLAVLNWTAVEHEGHYTVELSVRNLDTGEIADTAAPYRFQSRVAAGQPVVSEASHPLVSLYSAPACAAGDRMRVQFSDPDGVVQNTPWKVCTGSTSMNFYLAGLRGQTSYSARHVLESGFTAQTSVSFTSGEPQTRLAAQTVLQGNRGNPNYPVLLQGALMSPIVATDVRGNLVWYYPFDMSQLTRFEEGGLFWGIDQPPSTDKATQLVRQWDVVGMTVRETNSARLSEQVMAMGGPDVGGVHHEAIRLPDGNIAVLAGIEQIMSDIQGPGTYNVLGDIIIVLNDDMQVIWFWNAFGHLDVRRKAILGQTCAAGGCPTVFLSTPANTNDWVHGNAITYTPDGNLLYSSRHQDWVVKIHYANASGSGDVLWRLGKDGDFRYISDDPWPWFSHQHDAEFDTGDYSNLSVFDNGNTRFEFDRDAHSRGQIIHLDEVRRTATLLLNADLGTYAFALGNAQPLEGGTCHFNVGWVPGTAYSRGVEVDSSGRTVYSLEAAIPVYRSFRLRDLYSAR